ncbi:hypothetical protein [Streptomyces sp. NPDC002845]
MLPGFLTGVVELLLGRESRSLHREGGRRYDGRARGDGARRLVGGRRRRDRTPT